MDIIESVTKYQVDCSTPTAKALVEAVIRLSNTPGPIYIQAALEDRAELNRILMDVKVRKKLGRIHIMVEPDELRKAVADDQPDACLYAPGESLPMDLQESILKKLASRAKRHLLPPVFLILSTATAEELREAGQMRADFYRVIEGRQLKLTPPSRRSVKELKDFFHVCLVRAATTENVRFRLPKGFMDFLESKWQIDPPASLLILIAVANKLILETKRARVGLAQDVALAEPLLLSTKDLVNGLFPDSELADRSPGDATVH